MLQEGAMALLEGRVVLVTGGGRGIGRSHCLELAGHGATVVVNDLGVGVQGDGADEAPARHVVQEIEAAGGTAMADPTSVTDFEGVGSMVKRIVAEFGRLDAVVNNAGILRDAMVTKMSEDDWDVVIATHLKGTFAVTKHACDYWRTAAKGGRPVSGRVVNTTSGTGLFGNVGQANYGAAKAAIAAFTVITAMEMDRYHVTVNAISPLARTRMTESILGAPVGPGEWDNFDAANSSPVVAWLVSERSGWLSGAILRVDGNEIQRVRPWEVDAGTVFRAPHAGRLEAGEIDAGLRRAYRVLPRGTSGLVK
jgi:NAD(P)-dependent dehydrogenase (short-subunit alcohol dehydrogenase family)